MKLSKRISTQGKIFSLLLLFLLCGHACTSVRLISEYDPITDEKITELEEKVAAYFVQLERTIGTEEADYEHYQTFFDEAKVDLNTLAVRAAAVDKNRIVQEQVKELQNMVSNLEFLHKMGFASAEQLPPLKTAFNSAFTAIIRLQMALKRGESYEN
ncbi:hypothetical protein FKX85_05225 [Echinicola soli]|uniref:Uncharacterized protein n=1 Tax=Echinicola soli TaxID=2591634 RepID=A0A514CF49_9BACT|nr:hypothetical protein [Echinicola soli]QDH78465.1 hypothetical protein FKX85_05225 [Echinicola soli]